MYHIGYHIWNGLIKSTPTKIYFKYYYFCYTYCPKSHAQQRGPCNNGFTFIYRAFQLIDQLNTQLTFLFKFSFSNISVYWLLHQFKPQYMGTSSEPRSSVRLFWGWCSCLPWRPGESFLHSLSLMSICIFCYMLNMAAFWMSRVLMTHEHYFWGLSVFFDTC